MEIKFEGAGKVIRGVFGALILGGLVYLSLYFLAAKLVGDFSYYNGFQAGSQAGLQQADDLVKQKFNTGEWTQKSTLQPETIAPEQPKN